MLFVSYLQQCHNMSMPFSFQGPQLGLRLTWTGASTPEANTNACVPIQLVTYWCIDASFTGALKKIQDICKKFMTWSKFQDISGQLISRQCHIYHIYPVVYASCTRGPNGCYYAQQMATQCTTVLLLVLANQLPRLRLYGHCWLSVT